MKLNELTEKMWAYNQEVAPGSECNAWQDYHAWCHGFGCGPMDEDADTIVVRQKDVDYWLAVSNGKGCDHDADGNRKG